MKINLDQVYELSNEHSASSYGIPVIVEKSTGEAFGKDDLVDSVTFEKITGKEKVEAFLFHPIMVSQEEKEFAEKFLE